MPQRVGVGPSPDMGPTCLRVKWGGGGNSRGSLSSSTRQLTDLIFKLGARDRGATQHQVLLLYFTPCVSWVKAQPRGERSTAIRSGFTQETSGLGKATRDVHLMLFRKTVLARLFLLPKVGPSSWGPLRPTGPQGCFQLWRKVHEEQRAGEKPGPLHPVPLGTSPASVGPAGDRVGGGRSVVMAW